MEVEFANHLSLVSGLVVPAPIAHAPLIVRTILGLSAHILPVLPITVVTIHQFRDEAQYIYFDVYHALYGRPSSCRGCCRRSGMESGSL